MKKFIAPLTSLRFFAIILVVAHHANVLCQWIPHHGWGNVGVTFFFILSGFVLTLNYRVMSDAVAACNFFWRRFVRLYPLHIITFLSSILVLHYYKTKLDLGFISALLNISLLQSWFAPNEIHFAFNSVSWSISSLAFFYMAFAFIQCNFKRCFLIACFISLLSLVLSGWYAACHHIDIAKTQWLLQIFPANRLAVFLFGMIFAKSHFRLCARFEHINIVPASILELLAILLVADRLSSCILINHLLKIVFTITGLSGQFALQIIDGYLFMPIMFGTLLLIFSMQQGIISMLLSKRPFVILGELSFAVYLFHQLVFRALSVLKAKTDMSTALSLALACTATMVLSYLIFRYVEQPSARGLKQVFEKDKHRTIVSPTPSVS